MTVLLANGANLLFEGLFWAALLLPLLLWASVDIRTEKGEAIACAGCRYPRAGLPQDAPCPECGGVNYTHAIDSRVAEWTIAPLLGVLPVYVVGVVVIALVSALGVAMHFNTAEPWPTAWANAWYLLAPHRLTLASTLALAPVAAWLFANVFGSPRQAAVLAGVALAAVCFWLFTRTHSPDWYWRLQRGQGHQVTGSHVLVLTFVVVVVCGYVVNRTMDGVWTTHIWRERPPRS